MTIAEFIVQDYGPIGVVLAYLVIDSRRQRSAILCLAENVDGVDKEQVREKFRIVDNVIGAD